MKLFLTSIGLEPENTDHFLELLGKDPKEIRLAYIPTACDPEPDKTYVRTTKEEIETLGISVYDVDLKDENENSLYEKLKDADVICVGGGNTFYLLDWVRKSGFDKIIRRLLDEGKVYFGISAGTLIACPDIAFSGWKSGWDVNVVDLKDTTGLGLIDYVVSPHYKPEDDNVIKDYENHSGLKVVPLTDQEAIVING